MSYDLSFAHHTSPIGIVVSALHSCIMATNGNSGLRNMEQADKILQYGLIAVYIRKPHIANQMVL